MIERPGERVDLEMWSQEKGWWDHEVRDALRDGRWREEKINRNRNDFEGSQGASIMSLLLSC